MANETGIWTVNLLDINVFAMSMNNVLDLCEKTIEQRSSLLIGVLNVAKAVNSRKDNRLRKSLDDADIVVADGRGIIWLSKLVGKPLPERVAGIDIMCKLFERASEKKYRVYFLGAKQHVVEKVVNYVGDNHPGLVVAGYHDGYFDDSSEKEVADDIRDSKADILFVAVPSPKKENFLSKWREYMNVPVCHGVGGSFDVVAGVTKRAPLWMQKYGLEWFYRVMQEPGRMWKRYLVTNSVFAGLALKETILARLGIAKP